MKIIKGKMESAKKIVIYGPEGIGKSTFASQFPDPVFIDTEGSTKDMDVARFERAESWTMLQEQIRYVIRNTNICKTLVIDTVDWAEQMCVEDLCARNGKKGIEDFGYGNGYVYAKEEFGRFLNLLEEVVEKGIHVVTTAHAQIRKFEQPNEMGAYDRWELKIGKKTQSQTAPLLKEWADMVLFANYKILVYNVDNQGAQKGKNKAQGGKRVMYTSHHPCWDAKNRYGLPDEIPFDYGEIAHIIGSPQSRLSDIHFEAPEISAPVRQNCPVETEEDGQMAFGKQESTELPNRLRNPPVTEESLSEKGIPSNIPKNLQSLMREYQVCEMDIQAVVGERGYFPSDMRIADYPPDFISGVLVGAWDKVYKMIQDMRQKLEDEIPFKN